MRIRDPIHGTLSVSDEEKTVVDSRFYQRLRHVRQLGFGELAFPGATHTRHAHSLGAMHVSGRLFDAVAERGALPARAKERFRAAVRFDCGDVAGLARGGRFLCRYSHRSTITHSPHFGARAVQT